MESCGRGVKKKTNLRATIVIYFVVWRQGVVLRRPESLRRVTLTAGNTFRALTFPTLEQAETNHVPTAGHVMTNDLYTE